MIFGLLLVLIAACFQGTFLMPMALTVKWTWEHSWAVFSLSAMLLLNWAIALASLPNPVAIYASVPRGDLLMMALFGAGWGVGAVLFGLGMDKLGLTLGYPLIMGLTAATGALVPMIWFAQESLVSARSLTVALGTTIAIAAIILCSLAGARNHSEGKAPTTPKAAFASGLLIAIAAGCLCGLPNVGMTYGKSAVDAAKSMGASAALAGNAVWAVFFTLGGVVNLAYCLFRILQRGRMRAFAGPEALRNVGLVLAMSLMWIGSFYFYGMGAARMGAWGAVVGWPVLMSGSIGVGIVWGLWKGEWRGAPVVARRLLGGGLLLILSAVLTLAYANTQ